MSRVKIESVSDDFWDNIVNEINKEFIESFLDQGHLSPKTLKQYESSLKIFAKWIYDNHYSKKEGREKLITELRPRDALGYQNWLIKTGMSPSGTKFKRSTVSSLCTFIESYYDEDEYKNFRNIFTKAIPSVTKSNVKDKIPLTMKEIEMISKELTKREDWQKLAYLWFTYISGCRREESRQLLTEVVGYNAHVIKGKNGIEKRIYKTHNIRAKGSGNLGNVRTFAFDERAMIAIKKWVETRKDNIDGDDKCPYFFVSKKNGVYQQISANAFNSWCEIFSEIIGGKKVHPHLFRSSRATIAKQDGIDIKDIQDLLGHASSSTTEIYIIDDGSERLGNMF